MSKLLRHYSPGQVYFVTSVTHDRRPFFERHSHIFVDCLHRITSEEGADVQAWVLLPDHFHMIVDPRGGSLSALMKRLKLAVSHRIREKEGLYRGSIWQARFWDHVIRDQEDMNRHLDYIHYNPVKHGLTANPREWSLSSFHDYSKNGYYPDDWGLTDPTEDDSEFGE